MFWRMIRISTGSLGIRWNAPGTRCGRILRSGLLWKTRDAGGDDYITKPFGMRELLARVKAVLRRFEQPVSEPTAPVIKFDDVEIDRSAMQLRVKGEAVPTTGT